MLSSWQTHLKIGPAVFKLNAGMLAIVKFHWTKCHLVSGFCRYEGQENQAILETEALSGFIFEDDAENLKGAGLDVDEVKYDLKDSKITIYFKKVRSGR
jgi:hypothetical protein